MYQLPKTLLIKGIEYQILSILGQGAYGRVYLAENKQTKYAIKVQECFAENELSFYQKILSNQKLRFRNVINIFAIEKINRQTYIVMEQAESSLYEQITRNTFPKQNIRYVMKEIANGIKELHDIGLTHRDIKPENILIKTLLSENNVQQQVYKICDFGTIKDSEKLVTQKLGTPYYVAPEQLNLNHTQYSNKVDIWAFGAMCYELLTGDILFNGSTVEEIQRKVLQDDVNQKIQQNIQQDYLGLLLKMLDRDPDKRCDIHYVIKQLEPKSRSVSRQNQCRLPKPSIREGNNYFINQTEPTQVKKRSFSGLDIGAENNQISTASKSPMQFKPNYQPPLPLKQAQKFNYQAYSSIQSTQPQSNHNIQSSNTIQIQKQQNSKINVFQNKQICPS